MTTTITIDIGKHKVRVSRTSTYSRPDGTSSEVSSDYVLAPHTREILYLWKGVNIQILEIYDE